jgi:2-hydroxy-6-oxonona-2,4-dienedioate hydrolase
MEIKKEGKFQYVETGGSGKTLLLLHGLMGALSNFGDLIEYFRKDYNVVLPILPIFELPLKEAGLEGLLNYIDEFIIYKDYREINVLGNSLGGHLSQLIVFKHPELFNTMTLTGSSGLFESSMGSSFPRRGDYEYIKNKVEVTFYDPAVATKELVDDVYDIVNDKSKAIRVVITAKTAIRHNVESRLKDVTCPTLLIWGADDSITPPFVAEKFKENIKNSELHFIDKCGHAPMMEHPAKFNDILNNFLSKYC